MAKKETAKQFTIGDLVAALHGHTLESAINTLLGSKGAEEHAKATGGKGKGKGKASDDDEEEEEEEEPKGKGKKKAKDEPKLDKKQVAELRKEAAKLAKAIDKLDDDDALEEVEDLLGEYEVATLKEVADEDIKAVVAKLEDILEDYE